MDWRGEGEGRTGEDLDLVPHRVGLRRYSRVGVTAIRQLPSKRECKKSYLPEIMIRPSGSSDADEW